MSRLIRLGFGLILFALWWVLSEQPRPLLLGLGLAGSMAVAFLIPQVPAPGPHWLGWAVYAPWLLRRIVMANLHVARLILTPKPALDPHLIEHRSRLRAFPLRALMAQSITLTPGTITTNLKEPDGVLTVHAIDEASASDITGGALERAIGRLAAPGAPAP
ncbi:MAG TPA: Na+/H+ antiporter subunit E [bacterium]